MFRLLGELIRKLIDGITNIITYIVLLFWLWIPAVYSVTFVAVCVFLQVSVLTLTNYFFSGLIFCLLLSALMVLYSSSHKQHASERRGSSGYRYKHKPEKPDSATDPQPQQQIQAPQQIQPQPQAQQQVPIQPAPVQVQVFQSPHPMVSTERPKVYATRRDPNTYIYDYSDRIEVFQLSGGQMLHIRTEYKPPKVG